MQPKSYEILMDIKHGLINNQIIEVVTGDYGMNNFKFKLLRDRLVPYDLTNTIVRIMVVTPSGSEQQQDCIVENPVGGTLDLTLKQSLFAESGAYAAEIQVYDKDTQVLRVTFPRFGYYARKSLQDDETVQASDEYSILQQLISETGDINNNINNKVDGHNSNEHAHPQIQQELAGVIQQSNEIATDVIAHKAESIHQGEHLTLTATSTDDATSVTDAPLKSDGGFAVVKKSYFGDGIKFGGCVLKSYDILQEITNTSVININYLGPSYGSLAIRLVFMSRYRNTPFTPIYKEVLITCFMNNGVHLGKAITVIREIGTGIDIDFVNISGNEHALKITNNVGDNIHYTGLLIEVTGSRVLNNFGELTII